MKISRARKYYDKYGHYYLVNNSKAYVSSEKNGTPLYIHLKYKYENILWQMLKDEFYIIQDRRYDIIKEICYNGNVIGYTALNFYGQYLIMELCYILPKYRNMGLFCKELITLKEWVHENIALNLPNRFAIESLINNGLAVKKNDYIVKSEMPLSFRHPIKEDIRLFTYYYDLRICGCVHLNNYFISPLLDVDIYCFNGDTARDKLLDENYFKEFYLYI